MVAVIRKEQFTVDTRRTPPGILPAHHADQTPNFTGNDRPSGLASRKPARCEATTVSGSTMASAECQSRQTRDSQTHNWRSPDVNFGRFLADR